METKRRGTLKQLWARFECCGFRRRKRDPEPRDLNNAGRIEVLPGTSFISLPITIRRTILEGPRGPIHLKNRPSAKVDQQSPVGTGTTPGQQVHRTPIQIHSPPDLILPGVTPLRTDAERIAVSAREAVVNPASYAKTRQMYPYRSVIAGPGPVAPGLIKKFPVPVQASNSGSSLLITPHVVRQSEGRLADQVPHIRVSPEKVRHRSSERRRILQNSAPRYREDEERRYPPQKRRLPAR